MNSMTRIWPRSKRPRRVSRDRSSFAGETHPEDIDRGAQESRIGRAAFSRTVEWRPSGLPNDRGRARTSSEPPAVLLACTPDDAATLFDQVDDLGLHS